MNDSKKISPIGNSVPTRENENNHNNSITDNSENIKGILEKLTELLQMTRAGCNIADIRKVGECAVVYYIDGSVKCVNIACDSGITAVYDIVKKIMK